VDLAALLVGVARGSGLAPRAVRVGDRIERLDLEHFEREGVELDAVRPITDALAELSAHLRPGSMRYLVSDFLTPHAPDALVRVLARNAGSLALVQVLAEQDRVPRAGAALRLLDAEIGDAMDLVVDERAVARYVERLARLESALADECKRCSATFVTLVADAPLEDLARGPLSVRGVLEPRR
jgi:hypothetical protein